MNLHLQKKILILAFTDIKNDPRVYRQLQFLKKHYQLTAAGFRNPEIKEIQFIKIEQKMSWLTKILYFSQIKKIITFTYLKTRQFNKFYWYYHLATQVYHQLSHLKFDLIIANDIETLPLALRLASENQAKVLLDAHEYEPRHFDDRWSFRFFFQDYWDYICKKYLPKVDAMLTVCPGIAEEYHKVYGVPCNVLTNAPFSESLTPGTVDSQCIRMIHHGALNPSRKLENMIFLMDLLDERFTLDFMLVSNDDRYFKKIQKLAQTRPRIRFIDPVSMPEICQSINQYDIGIFLLSPAAFSYRMALPNKLFEFIQARLAVAIWPSPEMARLVSETKCGVISKDFTIESMAEVLNSLSREEIQRFKNTSHQLASTLCAENNQQMLLEIVEKLMGSSQVSKQQNR